MKSILLNVGGDTGMEARLQVALDLARAFDGRITCLNAVNIELYAPGDFYGAAVAAAMPLVREAAEELEEKYKTELANEDVSWEWLQRDGLPEMHLLEQSALHDVILVGERDSGDRKGPSRMAGELALKAKCPVLVVPDSAGKLDVSAPIMIAWNGSPEACVALRAAVPLLAKSSKVLLASVAEAKQSAEYDFPSLAGIQYLARYGIEAELIEFPASTAKTADVLSDAAKARGCELLVMGAYGHSRLTETLLGGVTRSALTDPELPMLIAH